MTNLSKILSQFEHIPMPLNSHEQIQALRQAIVMEFNKVITEQKQQEACVAELEERFKAELKDKDSELDLQQELKLTTP